MRRFIQMYKTTFTHLHNFSNELIIIIRDYIRIFNAFILSGNYNIKILIDYLANAEFKSVV